MVSYTYPRLKYDVAVLKPRLDYLTFTLPVPDIEEQEGISSRVFHYKGEQSEIVEVGSLSKAQKEAVGPKHHVKKPSPSELKYYKRNYYIFPSGDLGKYALLQFDPKAQDKSKKPKYMRLRLNPNSLGRENVAKLWAILFEKVLGANFGWDRFLSTMHITRSDVAVDIIGARVMELMAIPTSDSPGKNITYTSASGRPQSNYYDTKSYQPANLYLYNKLRHAKDMKKTPEFGDHLIHTRLEVRRPTPNNGPGLDKIFVGENPLKKTRLLDCLKSSTNESQHKWMPDYQWQWFFDSCAYKGLDRALEAVTKEDREIIRKALKHAEKGIWKPDQLWRQFHEAVGLSGLMDDPFAKEPYKP